MSLNDNITLLHTADVHLGAKFLGLGGKGKEQRDQIRTTFGVVINLAVQKKVDALLLAGDTFDSNKPSPESLDCFRQGMQLLAEHHIPTLIIGGTHDCLNQESVLKELCQDMPQTLILLEKTRPWWRHPLKDICIYGVSQEQADYPLDPGRVLAELEKQKARWHVGILHAALELQYHRGQEAVITKTDIENSQMHYLALGHWHNKMDASRGNTSCWYPGSPEMVALDEKDRGQVLLVQLDGSGKIEVVPQEVGKRQKKTVTIDWSAQTSDELIKEVALEADSDRVLELILTGQVNPEEAVQDRDLLEKLEPLFFHISLKNRTHPRLGEEELKRFHEKTVIGTFVRQIQQDMIQADEHRRKLLEEAMQMGVQLLTGKDVAPWS